MDGEQTPYAMAVALRAQGASTERVTAALRARGLDDEGIALLLSALGARGEAAAPPTSEWTEPEPSAPDPAAPAARAEAPAEPCPRCGVFLTPATVERVLGVDYCSACAARPEVNYPRAYREARWGKRDGWAWFFGVTGVLSVLGGAFALLSSPAFGGLLVLNGVGGVLFWTGHPVGRPALIAGTALGAAGTMLLGSVPNVLGIAFVVLALFSARNRLFYKLEVSEAALAEAWRQEHDNQAARWAVATGALLLVATLTWLSSRLSVWVTFGLSGLPIALGAIGLAKVNPTATPPIGRRGQAIAGLVLGGLVAVASALVLASGWRGL
jgi:hypothetical protein